jgi:hypothetical protein
MMLLQCSGKGNAAMHASHGNDHLKDILGSRNGAPVADDSELPEPCEPYKAHARAANKPVYSLHCLLGKDGIRSFQYV